MTYDGTLSVQLYSVRDDLAPAVLESTLARLRDMGFTHVEPYDILGYTDALADAIAVTGLRTETAHSNLVALDIDAIIAAAKRLGVTTIIVPWVEPASIAERSGVEALAAKINQASRYAKPHGIRIGYHNHDFEFSQYVDGTSAYELMVELLDREVILELDTYWASVGGADVFELLPRLRDRVRFLHVKNEPPDAGDPPLLGVDVTGRMAEVLQLSDGFVERPVVEIVVDEGDVFPVLARNAAFFLEQVRA
jgi:sugar phosphate isomerase/epimerase